LITGILTSNTPQCFTRSLRINEHNIFYNGGTLHADIGDILFVDGWGYLELVLQKLPTATSHSTKTQAQRLSCSGMQVKRDWVLERLVHR
jgi:hypothetical protein